MPPCAERLWRAVSAIFRDTDFANSRHYPRISKALATLRTTSATLDGEAVWCDDARVAVIDKLRSRAHDDQVFLYAFGLLELEGEDWCPRPLEERKAQPAKLLWPVSDTASTSRATAPPSSPTPASWMRGHRLEAPRAPLWIRPE
jgi:ATP-dependent DNA ligase